MKTLISIILISFTSSLLGEDTQIPGENPYYSENTGILFPASLGDFRKDGHIVYKNPSSGISIRYSHLNGKADIYIYPCNDPHIKDGTPKEVLQQLREVNWGIEEMGRRGYYAEVKHADDGKGVFETPKRQLPFVFSVYSFIQKGKERTSYSYLTALNGQFIKIRYTILTNGILGDSEMIRFLEGFESLL